MVTNIFYESAVSIFRVEEVSTLSMKIACFSEILLTIAGYMV
jgi:hypothetical protein